MKPAVGRSIAWLAAALLGVAPGCGSEAAPPASEPPASTSPSSSPPPGGSTAAPATETPGESAPPPAPKLGAPYPVVLLHGMAGFEKIGEEPVDLVYFRGVLEALAAEGETEVYVTVAPPYATSEVRAQAIAKQLDAILARTNKAKVNLVGHSQGGLDARVLASPNGLAYGDRIASVTTVATPHRGSRSADAALGLISGLPAAEVDAVTNALVKVLQRTVYDLDTDAALRAQVVQLSEKHMREVFNPTYVDAPGVVYRSYAGRSNMRTGIFDCQGATYANPLAVDPTQPLLSASAMFLEEGLALKVNDGLVTVDSARWGTFEACVAADHFKQVGHIGLLATFDHRALFRDIVARLRASGL